MSPTSPHPPFGHPLPQGERGGVAPSVDRTDPEREGNQSPCYAGHDSATAGPDAARSATDAAVSPSPLGGEGARRAGEGRAARNPARFRTPFTPVLRERARSMRTEPTETEAALWRIVRNRRFAGYKFRRQVPMGRYIVDLYCPATGLIVELDGSQHADSTYDRARDEWLRAEGYRVLRIWNTHLLTDRDSVSDTTWHALQEPTP